MKVIHSKKVMFRAKVIVDQLDYAFTQITTLKFINLIKIG